MATTTKTTHPLVAKHAALIAEHDAITGKDQSSIARRAGKVRQVNLVELDLTMEGVKGWTHWVSPAATKSRTPNGQSDAELLETIERLGRVIADAEVHETIRATADGARQRKIKLAIERGLITEDGELVEQPSA
jgi:hypothetical protein